MDLIELGEEWVRGGLLDRTLWTADAQQSVHIPYSKAPEMYAFAMAKPTPETEAPKSVVCSPARDSRRTYCCDYCGAHPRFHVSWELLAKPHP